MLSNERKKDLLKHLPMIMTDLIDINDIECSAVKGKDSLAQELSNRIELVAKNSDEYRWMVDAVSVLILQSKNKEIGVVIGGKVLSKEILAKEYGFFFAPKKLKS